MTVPVLVLHPCRCSRGRSSSRGRDTVEAAVVEIVESGKTEMAVMLGQAEVRVHFDENVRMRVRNVFFYDER